MMGKDFAKWLMGITSSVVVLFVGAWIQINSRIAVLEVQVKTDHQAFLDNAQKLDDMMQNIMQVKETCISIQGDLKTKQDKFLQNEDEKDNYHN